MGPRMLVAVTCLALTVGPIAGQNADRAKVPAVTADGARRCPAERVEVWRGHGPVLSASDFRLDAAPDKMQLEGRDFRTDLQHGTLGRSVTADAVEISVQQVVGMPLRVTGAAGRMSAPGM